MTPIPTIEYRRQLEPIEVEDHIALLEAAMHEDDFLFGYVTKTYSMKLHRELWYLVTIHEAKSNQTSPARTNIKQIQCYADKRSIIGRVS